MSEPAQHIYSRYRHSRRKQRAWQADNPGNLAIRRELTAAVGDAVHLGRARRVLDIGCGTGWWLEWLAEREQVAAELHGVDLLEPRVEAARRRVPQAVLTLADARRLPYPDSQFDAAFLFTVLSSLPNYAAVRQALHEARRVLAPGGRLLVWEPRLPNPFNRATRRTSRRRVSSALGTGRLHSRSTTVFPPLARRLGRATPPLYTKLARLPPLRTHRLMWFEKPETRA